MAKQKQRKVAVIGAGWAGCAAALTLQERGMQVSLFEASRTAGGRARRIEHDGHVLDNGQHILLGAYQQTLRLIRQVGVDPDTALLRLPLQMPYPAGSGMSFIAAPLSAPLPAPLHLLWALLGCRGLSLADKLAMARFSSTARWMGWQLNIDCSVAELLERFDQTPRLIQLLWRPLCLAALNTPPDRASAKVFLAVLRDSLGGRRQASDMLLPRCDLSALFPEPALQHLQAHGAQVHLGHRISSVSPSSTVDGNTDANNANTWQLCSEQSEPEHFDALVVATDPLQASRLLGAFASPEMANFSYEAISTCYLQYAPQLRLHRPFFALLDDPAQQHWGQFVFDRGALNASQSGLLAVVVSASTAALELGHEALASALCIQLADALKIPQLAAPDWRFVVSEKRATFACTPGLLRPSCTTPHAGLVLAGDYTAGDYPATLEGAVRSGMQAALSLCSD